MQDSNGEISAPRKTRRLFRSVSITSVALILLLILLVAVPATVYLSLQQIQTHERWYWELRASQNFLIDLDDAWWRLNNTFFSQPSTNTSTENLILQGWYYEDLSNAKATILDLETLDNNHGPELYNFVNMLDALSYEGFNYVIALNTTERSTLAAKIETVGDELSSAYWSILNYTTVTQGQGPPFWYLGPTPPDQETLKQAADLAINITQQVSTTYR